MAALQVLWFVVLAVLVAAYASLDGYSLGIGFLTPFLGRGAEEQSMLRRTIEATWDGNEVLLILIGGLLFAAFPPVYASVLSGFYLVFMVTFFALIFRTVSLSLHYGGPHPSRGWRVAFWAGSTVPAFLLGVIAGNLIRGVDLSASGDYAGTIGSLLNPFAIAVGVLSLALVANQGAAWAAMKVTGDLHPRTVWTARITGCVLLFLFILVSVYAALALPDHAANVARRPLGWLVVLLTLGGLGYQQYSLRRGSDARAFAGGCAAVIGLVGVWFTGTFPSIVPAIGRAGGGLTISNSSAARTTLIAMTVILVPAAPLLVGVLVYVNRIFRGRVQAPESDRGY